MVATKIPLLGCKILLVLVMLMGYIMHGKFKCKAPNGSVRFGFRFFFLIGQNRKSLITRHPVIVERRNTARWNRLIETVPTSRVSPFYDHWMGKYQAFTPL